MIVAVSGGVRTSVGGLRISARSPLPVAILSLTFGALWYVTARREKADASDLEGISQWLEREPVKIISGVAIASAVIAATFATRSAAGADASGYISEAASLSHGHLFYADELFDLTRGFDSYLTSPLGWRPSPSGPMQSPTYPPGLPMLMAVPHAIAGANGAAALVIASGVVAVIATGLLAMQLGGALAGIIAATLIAFTPIFLYQSIQPMSDVPVTAAWMVCFALLSRQRSFAAGIACAIAVLIRPNLAPLAIVPLFVAGPRRRFAIPVAIAGATLAALQWLWYGSPLSNGYGSAGQLFALANVAGNAPRYFTWFISSAPAFVIAIAGLLRMRSTRIVQALAAFSALVIISYLVYAVFDDWPYLRFLLPAMAVFAVMTGIELAAWIGRAPLRMRALITFAVLLIVTAHAIGNARSHDTFKLADQLHRIQEIAQRVSALPQNAVIVSGEQSGSMRYYTGRSILRWEAATPEAMAASIQRLDAGGRPVYVVLDAFEEPLFRSKFAAVAAVALDWPALVDAGSSHRTRLWKAGEHDRFLRGEAPSTIRLP